MGDKTVEECQAEGKKEKVCGTLAVSPLVLHLFCTFPQQVEYFGQELEGMAFTEAGWVQSYGSRYVRPPIVCGDVSFVKPITVEEFSIAQASSGDG